MTFREMITDYYTKNGMTQGQAEAAFATLNALEEIAPMKKKCGESALEDSVDCYPPFVQDLVMSSARFAAIKWIDEHCPLACWLRSNFSPS